MKFLASRKQGRFARVEQRVVRIKTVVEGNLAGSS